MKKPDKLEAFFQTVVALVGERLKKVSHPLVVTHLPEGACWQGVCECNETGHWYFLYNLVERFWRNAPEVDADWEGEAKFHLWDPDALHELLVGAFLGETPKAKPNPTPVTQATWKGKPIIGISQQAAQSVSELHKAGVISDKDAHEFFFPPVTVAPTAKMSIPTFQPIPISEAPDIIVSETDAANQAKTIDASTIPPSCDPSPALTPGQKAARRRWEWENEW